MQKYDVYKRMSEDLTRAMKSGFYYQAIFIEYAILEDRLASVLKYAGIPYIDKNGQEIFTKTKLNRIETRPELSDRFYRQRFTAELLKELRAWLDERNELIHHLANMPYDSEKVKKVAEDGNELVRIVKNKSASIINHLKKEAKSI